MHGKKILVVVNKTFLQQSNALYKPHQTGYNKADTVRTKISQPSDFFLKYKKNHSEQKVLL